MTGLSQQILTPPVARPGSIGPRQTPPPWPAPRRRRRCRGRSPPACPGSAGDRPGSAPPSSRPAPGRARARSVSARPSRQHVVGGDAALADQKAQRRRQAAHHVHQRRPTPLRRRPVVPPDSAKLAIPPGWCRSPASGRRHAPRRRPRWHAAAAGRSRPCGRLRDIDLHAGATPGSCNNRSSCAVVFFTCEPTMTAPGRLVAHIGGHALRCHRLRRAGRPGR
jgi:hypothetical protein